MQIFERETTDDIAIRFRAYFVRLEEAKTKRVKYSRKEAQSMIDFAAGPAPSPTDSKAFDPSKVRVHGGGRIRPSTADFEAIIEKHEPPLVDRKWDGVFSTYMKLMAPDSETTAFIHLVFRDELSAGSVCEELCISEATFYDRRIKILTKIAVLAVAKSILKP